MNKCKNCGKEIESLGTKPKLYCSDACRKRSKRTEQTDKTANGQEQTDKTANGQEQTDKPMTATEVNSHRAVNAADVTLSQLIVQELYQRINRYKHDTWKQSPEYKELMSRLNTLDLEQLSRDGYWIPGWKVKQAG